MTTVHSTTECAVAAAAPNDTFSDNVFKSIALV